MQITVITVFLHMTVGLQFDRLIKENLYIVQNRLNLLFITILKGFPLNVNVLGKVGDDQYEVLDGQQRTLSVMQYLDHKYSISVDGGKYYCDSLPDDKYDDIMNYEFMVYVCEVVNQKN